MNHRVFPRLMCLALCICGCEDSWFTPQQTLQSDIQQAIDQKQFRKAAGILHKAQKLAKSDSRDAIEYNTAILEIQTGNCESALHRLETLLSSHTQNQPTPEISSALDFTQPVQDNQFVAHLHQALSITMRCPASPQKPSIQQSIESLEHMYQAYYNGMDTRDQISRMLYDLEPACDFFIPEDQGDSHHSAETAIDIAVPSEEPNSSYVLCPSGLWFKTHLRAHESFSGHVEMNRLERTLTLDDSASLPYAQFHIDIYEPTEDAASLPSPVTSFVQPLPDSIPVPDNYQTLRLNLPGFTAEKTGAYYIHIYPSHLGEARLQFHIKNTANCDKIDDNATYTNDLRPIIHPLNASPEPQHFLLCPSRPDTFVIETAASSYSLVGFVSSQPEAPVENVHLQIKDDRGQQLQRIDSDEGKLPGDQSAYMIIRPHRSNSPGTDDAPAPVYLLLHNAGTTPVKYRLTIGDDTLSDPIPYDLFRADSDPCLPKDPLPTIPVNLDEIQTQKRIQLAPAWICPDDELNYRPVFSSKTPTLRVHTNAHFLSPDMLHKEDAVLQAFMQLPGDDRTYLVENGAPADSPWGNLANLISAVLQKPFTADSRIRISTSKAASGFAIVGFSMPDDKQQDDKNDESNPDDKQDKQNKKEDKSKGKDNENQSPDKPSETKATPKGPGSDGQGDEFTPDPNSTGNKASKYDPAAYERAHIDALLDAIEQGDYYVPLSGEGDSQTTDKDW